MAANAESFLETWLSDIAVDTEKNTVFYKNYSNMNTVIGNQRMSVSGVDEDEEALNLVKFQNAYNLSAKVISVMSEIYDKLNASFDLWEGEKDADPYIPEMLDYLIKNNYTQFPIINLGSKISQKKKSQSGGLATKGLS